MITPDNLPNFLAALGFAKTKSIWRKAIGSATLEVDVAKQQLIYPEAQGLIVNERQTCNFAANENFVVFECVHRLLEKGYKPEHIELEPKWKLGHGASGGRADILIRDNAKKPLLIIECKTPGREFDKAWRDTQRDGDQLFSYAQQIAETQFLCLYASDFAGDTVSYVSNIVAHRDNQKYLEDNPQFKSFKDATDVKERFAVWRDTYKLDCTTKGIFEDNIQPYHIGKDKYSLADLREIGDADQKGKYHEFATILRQHNVSGRENAFDKLVNLFLCKLVDETRNPHDLKFYWKGVAYDTHFDLLDRMQQLYQAGMKEFLGEDITYIDQSAVRNAMRFIKQNPDATQKAVWQLFLQQKFFTNNDFSFIDVHNERLFYQNAEVLLKILQMWQDFRLTGDHKHNQFLGDLFEGFLDQGYKQSEGQYFTPMPICRFILMSLPLHALAARPDEPPRAIDYACGAGHFLNELAQQFKALLPADTDLAGYHEAIYGVEKEYRLSKVAKVSAFMYGQQGINICYGDALVEKHAAFPGIHDNGFDLLVANPPYSVKGFLETLPEVERARYTLTGTVKDYESNNSIECFFVERAKQLLKTGGIAAIILPSSILSNGGGTYVRAREILLQYFDIVAIAEFGSGTFGKTGTNTVTLFLRRKATSPDTAEHYRERVAEWFAADDNQGVYRDAHLIDRYAAHIGIAADDYKTLLAGRPNAALLAHETFALYRKAFDASSEIAALKKQKNFKAKPQAEQATELAKRFLAFVQAIERDKLYHFVLAADQTNPVLIVKSPTDTKTQKAFLGYDWSSAKGDEGIKLVKDAHGRHVTVLYDETDRRNAAKLNRCISDNFDGTLTTVPVALADYASTARLVDMLDFSRVEFEKQFSLTTKAVFSTSTQWPLMPLREVATLNPSKSEIKNVAPETMVSFVEMAAVSESGYIASMEPRKLGGLKKGSYTYFAESDIIIAKITPCMENGKCALATGLTNGLGMGSSEFHVIRTDRSQVLPAFAFAFLNRAELRAIAEKSMTGASGHRRVPEAFYAELKIPVPPLDIQQQIVAECEAVDNEVAAAQANIIAAQQSVTLAYESAAKAAHREVRLNNTDCFEIFIGRRVLKNEITDNENDIPVFSANVMQPFGFTKNLLIEDFSSASVIWGIDGDWMVNLIPANLPFFPTDHCGVLRIKPKANIHPRYLAMALEQEGHRVRFSRSNRANTGAITGLRIQVPSWELQDNLGKVAEQAEYYIATAHALIFAAPARKQAIMQRYL